MTDDDRPRRAALLRPPVRAGGGPPAFAPRPAPLPEPLPQRLTEASQPAVRASAPPRAAEPSLRSPPRELIDALPPFEAIDLDRITVARSPAECAEAFAALLDCPYLGFDTESKPTFVRGEVSDGPHLVQFASAERAWLLPLAVPGAIDAVARILAATAVLKIGFGLDSDRVLLTRRIGSPPRAVLDLDSHFRAIGYRGSLGLRSAVAVVLGRQFTKSKRVGTSNWALTPLGPAQIRYAANDAYGAVKVYEALQTAGLPAP